MIKMLVADSCLCWITILKYIEEKTNNAFHVDYLADNQMNPFWLKTKEEIQSIVKDRLWYMQKNDYNVLLIPCNTASNAIDDIKDNLIKEYKIQIITMVDAFSELISCLKLNKDERMLLIWTKFTIQSKTYENMLYDRWYTHIIPIVWTNMERIVASGKFIDKQQLDDSIERDFSGYLLENSTKNVVLACSCFYFATENIGQFIDTVWKGWIVFHDPIWSLVDAFVFRFPEANVNLVKEKHNNVSNMFYTDDNLQHFNQSVNVFLSYIGFSNYKKNPCLLNIRIHEK